jgi:hypothetical protein
MTDFIFFVFNGAYLCGNGQGDIFGRSASDVQPHRAVKLGKVHILAIFFFNAGDKIDFFSRRSEQAQIAGTYAPIQ